MTTAQTQSNAAATDVGEFIANLDGGMFERKLSIALSQIAAAVTDRGKEGEVILKLTLKPIINTCQVHVKHTLKYTRPTMNGKSSEEENRTTSMYVGKYGALSLAHPHQINIKFSQNTQESV